MANEYGDGASGVRLADAARGHDNNFKLIRILAASAVLVSHSFPLSLGKGAAEPSLGVISLSALAVDAFFVTSGFLVTASLFNRQSIGDFVLARVLRIFPALWVMTLLTVFALGLAFTTLPAASYLSDPETLKYLAKSSTLFAGVSFTLPGVFATNPYSGSVNGSLWSLPYEVRMYALLAGAWVLLGWTGKQRTRSLRWVLLAAAAGAFALAGVLQFWGAERSPFLRLFFMFFCGAALHAFRERIVLHRVAFWCCCALLLACGLLNRQLFQLAYMATIGYVLLYLAYVPAGPVRRYNAAGDYSYGIYIYAFPIQQALAAVVPGIGVAALMLCAACVSLLLAAASWHLIEEPALALKGRLMERKSRRVRPAGPATPVAEP